MPTDHFAVAGVPATGATAFLRSGLVGRYAYCLADGESAADFVAVDPDTGDVCPALIQNGALYGLDALDTTTAAGPTCLVSNEGKRYKLNSLTTPFAVLSKASTSPPVSPAIGDGYLLYSTPSGAWAGKVGYIAIYTSRGWEFMLPPIGFRVYVEDEDSFYYRDSDGDWQAGLGAVLVPDASIALSKLIWDEHVENQTTNAPPSAAQGTAYIIGSSPTGAWAGNAGKLAIREEAGTGSTYAIYAPKVGQEVYDKTLGIKVRWTGAAWVSAAGVWVGTGAAESSASVNATLVSGSEYTYSDSSPPNLGTDYHTKDPNTLAYTAKRSGARLRFTYNGRVRSFITGSDFGYITAFLFRDSVQTPLDHRLVYLPNSDGNVLLHFECNSPDTLSHTWGVGFTVQGSGATSVTQFGRRRLRIEEGG